MTATIPTYGDLSDYSLSKFTKRVDELAYTVSLDGCDEEEGTTEFNGHIGLLLGHLMPGPVLIDNIGLTPRDLAFVNAQQGAIVETHPSGAVYVTWFTDGNAAQAEFNAIRSDYATPEDWEY